MTPRIAIAVGPQSADRPNTYATYRFAVEQAGGRPELVTPPAYLASVADVLAGFDGVLLPGGADVSPQLYGGAAHPAVEPARAGTDEFQIAVARVAARDGIPLLGICRGMQVINVALGGSLYEDIDDQYRVQDGLRVRHYQTPDHARDETTHVIEIAAGSRLAALVGATTIATNTLHHQAVRRIPAALTAVARSRDGIVEGVEAPASRALLVGVQWHPEELVKRDEPSRALFRGFVASAEQRAQQRTARAS
ncbi:MAG: gamma-glutamyl-gamma-aminobutyrate hydrolase family protein [Candidatus Eremiobacteraeota bacterium]|nr:gamma-glutamyl-gamma-aminobutyrate hydrolase family protein [Candidatus Eremiobacteraeota bacterium]MBV8366396.1 gamma-glutamyl-gamma-aminobutyrate hydrolase family protein [Candidatus Eremiobacteraeota bacterium]